MCRIYQDSVGRIYSFFFDSSDNGSETERSEIKKYLARKKKVFQAELQDKIVVTVLDTGKGISKKDQKKVVQDVRVPQQNTANEHSRNRPGIIHLSANR